MSFPADFQTIQNAVIAKAKLDATADLSAVKDWINQAYTRVCVENEVIVSTANQTLVANTATYDLTTVTSNGISRIKNVSITSGGQVYGPLAQTSLEWILWQRRSSGGTAVDRATAQYYALSGYKTLDLYPTPAQADTLSYYYVAYPTALSANGDIPVLQEPWGSKLLEYGALAEAADFKNDPYADQYRGLFDQWTSRYTRHLNLRRGQPGAFEPFHAGAFPPHDPSTILPMNG